MTTLNVRTLTSALLVATAFSGCAWRRLDPPRVERPVLPLVDEAVGLLPADPETSLADLQSLSRIWMRWGAFRAVQFPYREGDPVDLVLAVQLRQRMDAHATANRLKGVAVALSFWSLSPVLGTSVSELHDVHVDCRRAGFAGVAVDQATVRSDLELGYGADAAKSAKELDDIQMQQLAARILDGVASQCRAIPQTIGSTPQDPRGARGLRIPAAQ